MARRKGVSSISFAQVMALIGLILAGYFVVGFAKVALVGHRLRETKAALETEVAALTEEVANLETQKEFVQTDAYIEQAAREELKMSRPGDKVIVPMFQEQDEAGTQQSPQLEKSVASTPMEPWRAWWELFFGQ